MANNPKLGVDLAWPLAATAQGDLAIVADVANVAAAMRRRLSTRQRQHFAHPDYGNGVHDILSGNITDTWIGQAQAEIFDCLAPEPRVTAQAVDVTVYPEQRKVVFAITYTIIAEPGEQNLIWEEELAA